LIIFSAIITTLYISDKFNQYNNEKQGLEKTIIDYKATQTSLSTKLLKIIDENKKYEYYFKSLPYGHPLDTLIISSSYGWRIHPIDSVRNLHTGIDFKAIMNTKIYSTGDGVVVFAGYKKGYGKCIIIQHVLEHKSVYGHLNKLLVKNGQQISKGTIIGLSGQSGVASGPHLHYEIRISNTPTNPYNYLYNNRLLKYNEK
jgi:murein DD-endopeptidase MepM/ murein hydrolase activator NlpD